MFSIVDFKSIKSTNSGYIGTFSPYSFTSYCYILSLISTSSCPFSNSGICYLFAIYIKYPLLIYILQ
jgi:hypothetical protein